MSELSLNVSRVIKAPIESIYNAWIDPKILAKFMLPGEGMTLRKVEVDPKEGGVDSPSSWSQVKKKSPTEGSLFP